MYAKAQSPGRPRSVVIAEPLALVREGFAALCEASGDITVLAQCEDGETALREIGVLRPDLAVLDLNLTRLFTLEVIRKARALDAPTKTIVLGTRSDRKTVFEILRAGASAYVLKSGPSRHLLDAFEQVLSGGIYVSPLLDVEQIFVAGKKPESSDPLEKLSAREYEVFTLLVEGIRAKEIAARLDLSPKTVDTYRASLMRKLDIHDVAGLVKFAIHRKLIPMS
jgi:DNA-binding NarL/FixJ family response regulator